MPQGRPKKMDRPHVSDPVMKGVKITIRTRCIPSENNIILKAQLVYLGRALKYKILYKVVRREINCQFRFTTVMILMNQ